MHDLAYLRRANRQAKEKHADGEYLDTVVRDAVSKRERRIIAYDRHEAMREHRENWYVRAVEDMMRLADEEMLSPQE